NILKYVKKDDPQGEYPEDSERDLNFSNWEEAVLKWTEENAKESNKEGDEEGDEGDTKKVNVNPPTEICSVREDDKMPILKIASPQNNQIVKNNKLAIKVESFTVFGLKQLDFYFDDILIGVGKSSPYEVSYNLPANTKEGLHTVTVRVYDQVENSTQEEITVIVSNENTSLYLKPILDTDFPFVINAATSGKNIKKVDFYYQLDSVYDADMNLIKKSGSRHKIDSADYPIPGGDNLYQTLWEEDKKYFISGKYKIFAIMEDKDRRTYESNKRFVEVK
ncbi:hypothetical protein KAS31_04455, partial [Candidatus Parcubacteria bacterium]|nr:hypothetical protein [Candidatus Parcubacteria bacterium]